ncbi:Ja35 [Japanese cytomegalovirus]|nr:Ja35 [Japanese cytomegalovirus]
MEHALFDHFFGRPRANNRSRHSLLRTENDSGDDEEEYPPIPRVPQAPQTTRTVWNIVDVCRLLPLQMRLMVAEEEEKMRLTTSPRTHKKKNRKLVEISPRIRRLFT